MSDATFSFKGKVWLWQSEGPGAWHFVTLPKDLAVDIKDLFQKQSKGFGSLKVKAQIGNTTWNTSIFPTKEHGSYLLPLKANVRKSEKFGVDDNVEVSIEISADD